MTPQNSRPLLSAALAALMSITQTAAPVAVLGLSASGAAAAQSQAKQEYVLGAGDTIRITVYQSPDLSLEARISENGTISYPLLGQLRMGGLSVSQAERVIADGLRTGNLLKSPQVTILITQVRGNQANALGMVGKPGRYPIEVAGMRLSDLLASAGGIVVGGSDIVILSGTRNGQPFRRQIDLPALLTTGSAAEDLIIQNGDTVFVDRMSQIYIYGEVQHPGLVRLERNMSVLQALAAGGGLTARGTDKGLKVHRTNGGGRVDILEPGMTDQVKDGDVIYVRQSLF